MPLAVYLPLVRPLLARAAGLAAGLPAAPALATWLPVLSAIALALASSAVVGMLTLTAVVHIPLVDSPGGMSGQVISAGDPASVPAAFAAGPIGCSSRVTLESLAPMPPGRQHPGRQTLLGAPETGHPPDGRHSGPATPDARTGRSMGPRAAR